jgi:uncharacterized membrane protein
MFLLIIPYSIATLPCIIICLIHKDFKENIDKTMDRFWLSVGTYIVLFIGFSIASFFGFFLFPYDKDGVMFQMAVAGGVFLLIGFMFLIIWLFKKIKDRKQELTCSRTVEHNVFVEFVKAKYKKYCPKIEWYKK